MNEQMDTLTIDEYFEPIFEIEFLTKKIEIDDEKNILTYYFNVTEEKENEVNEIFKHQVNKQIISELPFPSEN